MNPERWRRVEGLLDAALDLPPAERLEFLQRECPDDPGLPAEVMEILEAGEDPASLLDRPAARVDAVVAQVTGEIAIPLPERVGVYRLERVIGQGGMGTVFLAHRDDGQFDQQVALKLVRRGLHLDPRIVRRFREERQILAALNHPGIARLLDGGLTEDGLPYFAMEYVEGEAINRYCDRNFLGVEDRLELFVQVCDALAHAHEKQIVHRDIKPSNILVTREGHPRLLDFGIAKLLVADEQGADATRLTRGSERLLTPEYASPEQIRGEPVVAATDVYCLGVLLYELLTGQRPFRRAERTAHELERAVLEEDPTRPSEMVEREPLRRRLKGDLDSIVLTAMRKEPERRYPSARELAADVRRHLAGGPVTARRSSPWYQVRRWVRRNRMAVRSAAAVALLTAIVATALARKGAPDLLVSGATRRVTFEPELELDPVLSPDGRRVAYVAGTGATMRLHVKEVGGERGSPIAEEVPGFHRLPRWSADGRRILFQGGLDIYEVAADGSGVSRKVVSAGGVAQAARSPAWSPDGRQVAYEQAGRIYVQDLAGGSPRLLAGEFEEPHSLAWSPDGRFLAVVRGNSEFVLGRPQWTSVTNLGNAGPSSIWILPVDGSPAIGLTDARALNGSPVWMPDQRRLLFVSNRDGDRDIYSVVIDRQGRARGQPQRLTTGLGAHSIALSADGRSLVYSVFRTIANVWWAALPGRNTREAPAAPLTRGTQSIEGLALSSDGKWIAFDSDRHGNQDIYRMPVGGGEPVQVTSDPADEFMPHWSPDAGEIAYYRFTSDGVRRLETVPAAGGTPAPVVSLPRVQRFPAWSPDGRSLAFHSTGSGSDGLFRVSRDAEGQWGPARRLTSDSGREARWSPDGREVLYIRSDGLWTVGADGTGRRQVLRLGPSSMPTHGHAEWSRDGREIFFKRFDQSGRTSFWSVPAGGGTPRELLRLDPGLQSHRPEFATDGRRFYFTVTERLSDIWIMELLPVR